MILIRSSIFKKHLFPISNNSFNGVLSTKKYVIAHQIIVNQINEQCDIMVLLATVAFQYPNYSLFNIQEIFRWNHLNKTLQLIFLHQRQSAKSWAKP